MSKIIIDQVLEYHTSIPRANIAGPMTMEDLQLDSLDCVEICMDLEDKLKIIITDEELDAIKIVQDIYDLIDFKQAEKPVNQPPIPKAENVVTEQKEGTLDEK